MMRMATIALAATLSLACGETAAFAHAQLEKAVPAVGGVTASPSEIRLTFSEGVEPKFSGVTLTAPDGSEAPLGQPRAEGGDARVLLVPVAKALAPGVYAVRWHAVSVDTHRTQGTFKFTVKP
jgi:copper resistance protein C